MKKYHVFSWWLHLEQAENSIPYMDSFETLDDAKAFCENTADRNDHAEILETQQDGSLKMVLNGYVEGDLSRPAFWKWQDYE